jgi:predicted deacylase
VLAAAIHHGQLRGTIEKIGAHAAGTQKKAAIVDAECYTSAPFAGHYEEIIPCGAAVKNGEIVGRLHDFDRIDDVGWPVHSGVSGVVVGQAWAARVQRGQHIVCVGKVLD